MNSSGQKLFDLLPALYRLRDAQFAQSRMLLSATDLAQLQQLQALPEPRPAAKQTQLDELIAKAARGPLQSLLMLIDEQLAAMANDLDQLYDDQFIETCAPWVIPYLGDLIGYQSVYGKAPTISTPRAEVADTISFRRRKGTVLVLEQLAADATGWGAHAVEFFKLLADTQYLNHIRPCNHYAPDLRRWEPRAYMNTGFDTTAHKVDVRRIAVGRGRYNLPNIGVFLWSLNAYGVSNCPATTAPATGTSLCYRFSPLNRDLPLFHRAAPQSSEITAPAQPVNVPDRLWRRALCQDLRNGATAYYGPGNSLCLSLSPTQSPIVSGQIRVCNLSGQDGSWANATVPAPYLAAVDPALGRIVLPPQSPAPTLWTAYYYGFNGDMGGGPYAKPDPTSTSPDVPVTKISGGGAAIQNALSPQPTSSIIFQITDNCIYQLPATTLNLPAGVTVELVAAPEVRPVLILGGALTITGGAESAFNLNGLLVSANFTPSGPLINVPAASGGTANQLSQLGLAHCTLDPRWALPTPYRPAPPSTPTAVLSAAAPELTVNIASSIVGALQIANGVSATISDSIIDAAGESNVAYEAPDENGGGALTLTGCTVIGKVHASLLSLVSNSIFWAGLAPADTWPAALWSDRQQQGCVRFSYLPEQAVIPRSFECPEAGLGIPGPLFWSLNYDDPGYCKLLPATDDSIRRGADDGGEMGAFHFLFSPLRETDLRTRLQEYTPVGMEFGIFYET